MVMKKKVVIRQGCSIFVFRSYDMEPRIPVNTVLLVK